MLSCVFHFTNSGTSETSFTPTTHVRSKGAVTTVKIDATVSKTCMTPAGLESVYSSIRMGVRRTFDVGQYCQCCLQGALP
jgi:hypothetical protein